MSLAKMPLTCDFTVPSLMNRAEPISLLLFPFGLELSFSEFFFFGFPFLLSLALFFPFEFSFELPLFLAFFFSFFPSPRHGRVTFLQCLE